MQETIWKEKIGEIGSKKKETTGIGIGTKGFKMITQEDLKFLSAPFNKETLGVKVQSTSKDKTKAMLVLYLQHTDVMGRLEQVDPAWSAETLEVKGGGEVVYVRMKLTVKGVTRENVGDGNDPKAAYSDALKRCAMLFGVGRYLYDSSTVWVEYNESKHKYKTWTIEEYEAALKGPAPASDNKPYTVTVLNPPSSGDALPPGHTAVPFGKNAGKQLRELSVATLENDLAYWEDRLAKEGKPPTGKLKEYLDEIRAYLDYSSDVPF